MNAKKLKIVLTFFGALWAAELSAQIVTGEATMQELVGPKWHMGTAFESGYSYTAPSDLGRDGSGDLSVSSAYANLKFQQDYDKRHFFTASLNYSYNYYDFSDKAARPFSSVNVPQVNLFYTGEVYEDWGAFAIADFSFGSAANASMWGGRSAAFGAGATYQISEDLGVGVGGIAYSRLEQTWTGLPMVLINWKINDNLMLRTLNGVSLFYDVFADNKFIISSTFQYVTQYYKLSDQSGSSRAANDSYGAFSVSATYNFACGAYASIFSGANFDRELKIRSDTVLAERIDVDAAPFFGVSLGYRF